MAYSKINLVASTTGALLVNVNAANRVKDSFLSCVMAYGNFGSGTLTLAVSPDGGTTFLPLKDKTGAAISLTSNGYANIEICGFTNNNTHPLQVHAVLTGATSPNLNIASFDNMG
jgi:hypothetical protein